MYKLTKKEKSKLIHLTYKILGKEFPSCKIERDPLHRQYPEINNGLYIYFESKEEAEKALKILVEAFYRRGFEAYNPRVFIDMRESAVIDWFGFSRVAK